MENKNFYAILIAFIIVLITIFLSFFVEEKTDINNKNLILCIQPNDLIFKIVNNYDTNIYSKHYKSQRLIFVNSILEANGVIRNNKIIDIQNLCNQD